MRVTGGTLKNRSLSTPKGGITRPSSEKVRQAVFNTLQHHIEASCFLDLFAGSGAMGIEALSRHAAHATFVENHPAALSCLRNNLTRLNLLSHSTVLPFHALSALKTLTKQKDSFDLIYIDPPYEQKRLQHQVLLFLDDSKLLQPGGKLFIEVFSKTLLPPLKHLTLEKERKIGSSHLYQYTT